MLLSGPEFARDIRARVCREPDACRRGSACCGDRDGREDACGRITRDPSHGGAAVSVTCIMRYHGCDQSMFHPRTKSGFSGSAVVQFFVQGCGHRVFDCRLYSVSGESSSHSLAETGGSLAPFRGMICNLSYCRFRSNSYYGVFAIGRFFPLLPVWMVLHCRHPRAHHHKKARD